MKAKDNFLSNHAGDKAGPGRWAICISSYVDSKGQNGHENDQGDSVLNPFKRTDALSIF